MTDDFSPTNDIVIIDDEPAIRRVLTHLLSIHGYTASAAGNGEEGLALVRAIRPRIVFCDVTMPGMNGHEVCTQIKGDPTLTNTHVIMLTASLHQNDRDRAVQSGADEFMPKPFSPREVAERVRSVLSLPEALAAAA